MRLENKVAENSGGTHGGHVAEGNLAGGTGGDGSLGLGDLLGGAGGGGGGISSEGTISSAESSARGHGLKSGGRSGSLGGGLGGDAAAAGNNTAAPNNLDALPGARLVAILVLGSLLVATHVVDNLEALVVPVRGSVREVGKTTSPLDGALGSILTTGNPGTELDLHGGLRITSAALNTGVLERADDLAVNDPVELLRGPLDGVGVESANGVGDGRESTAVVRLGAALAEVVVLDLGIIPAEPLPIDLIKVVRLEHEAGDDTGTWGSPQNNIDLAEEDVGFAADRGGLVLIGNGENSAEILIVGELSTLGLLKELVLALTEVNVDGLGPNGLAGRAVG